MLQDIIPVKVDPVIRVRALYTIHYFEFAAGYIFEGESHDFWELVYLDKGEADIGADRQVYTLRQGDIIFHKPGEFHSIWANHPTGPNIVVITFACHSAAMRTVRGKLLHLDSQERRLLEHLLQEARRTYGPLLYQSDQSRLTPLPDAPVGGVQLIAQYLEALLIRLLRAARPAERRTPGPLLEQEMEATRVTQALQAYMRRVPWGEVRFADVCRASGMGATALKALFQRYNGMGVMEYYRRLRVAEARRLLREGGHNVTEVAAALGYTSLHDFSRSFKRLTGMTPSEYLRSVHV